MIDNLVTSLCTVSAVQQNVSVIQKNMYVLIFFSSLVYYRILNIVALQFISWSHNWYLMFAFILCHLSLYYGLSWWQMLTNLPAMQETWIQSLGWADPQKKGKADHTSILAWIIRWTEEHGGLQSMGLQRVKHDWATHIFIFIIIRVSSMLLHYQCFFQSKLLKVIDVVSQLKFFTFPEFSKVEI